MNDDVSFVLINLRIRRQVVSCSAFASDSIESSVVLLQLCMQSRDFLFSFNFVRLRIAHTQHYNAVTNRIRTNGIFVRRKFYRREWSRWNCYLHKSFI